MRIPSGKVDQSIDFVAVDSTDFKTRKTGLTAFTVYRSRNGGTPVAYTTPTIVELSSANMPGVYALLIDEDTTIAGTSESEEYTVHIACATMAPVTRAIELYRPHLAAVVETGLSVQDVLKLIAALAAGAKTGFDTGSVVMKSADGTKNRISATVGSTGWTGVTLDLT